MDPLKDPLAKQTAAGIPLTGACDARGVPTKMSQVFGPFKDPKKGFALEMFFARRKNLVSFAANHCSNKCLSDGWLVATRDYLFAFAHHFFYAGCVVCIPKTVKSKFGNRGFGPLLGPQNGP